MSYAKVPKLAADCGIGFQSLNQVAENIDSVRELYLEQHSSGEEPTAPPSVKPTIPKGTFPTLWRPSPYTFGRHNHPSIARGFAKVDYLTGQIGSVSPRLAWATSSVIASVTRIDVGVHFIAIACLATWRAKVQLLTTAAASGYHYDIIPGSTAASGSNAGTSGFYLQLWEDSGTWTKVDGLSYVITVNGTLQP